MGIKSVDSLSEAGRDYSCLPPKTRLTPTTCSIREMQWLVRVHIEGGFWGHFLAVPAWVGLPEDGLL